MKKEIICSWKYDGEFGFSEWIDDICTFYNVSRYKFTPNHIDWLFNWFIKETQPTIEETETLRIYLLNI